MKEIRLHDLAAIVLTLALAAPPLWWAGEAFSTAAQSAAIERNETMEANTPLEWARARHR